jgi:O-acetyl-ADP-ribose deacetylase (regulator of RNase III)
VITVRTDDLAFVEADAIARPVNAELRATTPLMRRLEEAAGPALSRQLRRVVEPLAVGSAVVTGAGDLSAGLLIHGVVSSEEEAVSRAGVKRALTSALQRAADWEIAHLVITPFGLGAGNLEIEDSAALTAEALSRHVGPAVFPRSVTIVVETALEAEIFERMLARAPR